MGPRDGDAHRGNYAGRDLYIVNVLGIGEQLTHGIQIKYTKAGSYCRFQP